MFIGVNVIVGWGLFGFVKQVRNQKTAVTAVQLAAEWRANPPGRKSFLLYFDDLRDVFGPHSTYGYFHVALTAALQCHRSGCGLAGWTVFGILPNMEFENPVGVESFDGLRMHWVSVEGTPLAPGPSPNGSGGVEFNMNEQDGQDFGSWQGMRLPRALGSWQ